MNATTPLQLFLALFLSRWHFTLLAGLLVLAGCGGLAQTPNPVSEGPTTPPGPWLMSSPSQSDSSATPQPVPTYLQWLEPAVVRVIGEVSAGSGFIFHLEGERALVVTNHHVVDDGGELKILIRNELFYDATLLGYDADRDIAVLSICCSESFARIPIEKGIGFPALSQKVVALGYPRGGTKSVTATEGEIRLEVRGELLGLIVHDALLMPGNSGGALLTWDGRLLGVNVAISTDTEGLFYAVPIHEVQRAVAGWAPAMAVAPFFTITECKLAFELARDAHKWGAGTEEIVAILKDAGFPDGIELMGDACEALKGYQGLEGRPYTPPEYPKDLVEDCNLAIGFAQDFEGPMYGLPREEAIEEAFLYMEELSHLLWYDVEILRQECPRIPGWYAGERYEEPLADVVIDEPTPILSIQDPCGSFIHVIKDGFASNPTNGDPYGALLAWGYTEDEVDVLAKGCHFAQFFVGMPSLETCERFNTVQYTWIDATTDEIHRKLLEAGFTQEEVDALWTICWALNPDN